jgi:hypothetical protein
MRVALIALVAVAGCSQRTEMLVRVFNDDVAIPSTVNHLHLSVSSLSMVRHEEDVELCNAEQASDACHTLPLSVLLIPGSDTLSDQVLIEIDSFGNGAQPVISDAGRFLFTRGVTLKMDFVLHSICAGTDCASRGLACLSDGHCGDPQVTQLTSPDQGASEPDLAVPAGLDLALPRLDFALPLPDLRGTDLANCTPLTCDGTHCGIDPCRPSASCLCAAGAICQSGMCQSCGGLGLPCCPNGCDNGLTCDKSTVKCVPIVVDMACTPLPPGGGPGPLSIGCP